jgi:uncharacterized protein (DUF4415 family)
MSKHSDKGWRDARRKALRQLATMTDEEDAEIRAEIARDPDAFELTDEMWARMRPAVEVAPEIVAAYRRRRGPQKAPTKQLVSIRLDRDVVAYFRKRGVVGWQQRVNEALRKVARLKPKDRERGIKEASRRARRRPPRGR